MRRKLKMRRLILLVTIVLIFTKNEIIANSSFPCDNEIKGDCNTSSTTTVPISAKNYINNTTEAYSTKSSSESTKNKLKSNDDEFSSTISSSKEIETTNSEIEVHSTEGTTEETTNIPETTDENPPVSSCSLNDTSYNINDSNDLTINWVLNDLETCNTSNVIIVLINKSCNDSCKKIDKDDCLCEKEQYEAATKLNYTFSKILMPCENYMYRILIANSSEAQKERNITESIKLEKPKELVLINSTDTSLTIKIILSDTESSCQDINYSVECTSNEDETISKNSNTDIVLIENLKQLQNYSCFARVKQGETEWSEKSDTLTFTTNATDCNLTNPTYEINNQTNILTVVWETNGSDLCDKALVSIELTNKNCVEKCNKDCSCVQSIKRNATDLKYNFSEALTSCAAYIYEIQMINSSTASENFTFTFDAYRQFVEIENFIITDEEVNDNSTKLNMKISWDYKNVECLETFLVSARGQGVYYESSVQGYGHTFENLEACVELNINIYIKDHQDINATATHTMKRINPSAIENLSLSQEDAKTSIKIAWSAPKFGSRCIDRYFIRAKTDGVDEIIRNTSSTEYLLSDIIACVNYSITVSISMPPNNDENYATTLSSYPSTSTTRATTFSPSISPAIEEVNESSISGSIKTEPQQFFQPQPLQLKQQTDHSLSFIVVPSDDEKNKCPIKNYYVQCESNEVMNKTMNGKNSTNFVIVDGLEPFHKYSCVAALENENNIKSVWSLRANFMTKEGVPNAPIVNIAQGTINSTSFTIKWKEPTVPKGIIKQYQVYIIFVNFKYDNPPYCTETVPSENKTLLLTDLDPSYLSYTFNNGKPSSTYKIQIRASNQAYDGDFSSSIETTTKAGPSDKLQNFIVHENEISVNETYNKTIFIDFNYPCRANGNVTKFIIEFRSSEIIFNKTVLYDNNNSKDKYKYRIKIDELEPDNIYTINGYAYSDEDIKGVDHTVKEFKLKAGIPESRGDLKISSNASTTSVSITIPDDLFDSTVGRITHTRIFIHQSSCFHVTPKRGFTEDERQSEKIFWEKANEQKCIPEYDTGIVIENKGERHQNQGIGTEQLCESNSLCNGRLRPGTLYGLTFRLYTETGFADTEYITFSTNKEVPIVAISISILSILCLVFLIGFYISCRRTQELRKSALDSPYDRKDISVQNFQSYHILMSKTDNEKIKEEYKAIQYFSETLDRTYIASRANEKLNRYINIYPYDSTRVVLNDDEFENDYINASFINGYYYPREYIAAQGPKPDTVLDFWRMIIQHRVESIVMVTSLVESNKVKCHEYFPKLNGRLTSCNITITCTKEQNFPSYIKRLLIVEKNDVKLYVNHYYFCKWPDHGCPNSASDLIEFVKIVRNERQRPGETFVVHCSAGVGRTGTFIALDIMMQRIKKEAKINIFDLVKQLRSQRMKMVQSCDQYVFLYTAALELISTSRRANVFQNLRDTVLKFFNELEIPESLKRHNNHPNQLPNIVKKDEKETVM